MLKQTLKKVLPIKWAHHLSRIKRDKFQIGLHAKTYSGDGEDTLLNKLFKDKRGGFYVDIGSFHPKYISNTHILHKRGWSGINVDPNSETHKLFKKYRPSDINLQIGVAKENAELTYYSFSHAGVNTFNAAHAKKKEAKDWNELLDKKQVSCKPLSEIFSEYLPVNTKIDVLDIDVEGMDLEVLESNDWDKYIPSVILVEDREFRTSLSESDIYKFLYNRGYTFHSYMNITLVMIHSEPRF